MIVHGIRTLLLSQGSITDVLPPQTVNRVTYPAVFVAAAAQGVSPPYAVISDLGQDTMLKLADPVSSVRAVEIDIDVYGYSEPVARAATEAIRTFFDDYSGPAGSYTIRAVLWQDETYRYIRLDEGRDTRAHVSTTNYLVQFE